MHSSIVSSSPGGRDQRVRQALVEFRRIVTAVKRHLAVAPRESVLSGAQMWALWHVQSAPGLTVLELAEKLSVHQSTTSNLVEKLETAGCLRRERRAPDRRIVRLFVTRTGAGILKQAPDPANGALPNALNRLSGQELTALELALKSLSRELHTSHKTAT